VPQFNPLVKNQGSTYYRRKSGGDELELDNQLYVSGRNPSITQSVIINTSKKRANEISDQDLEGSPQFSKDSNDVEFVAEDIDMQLLQVDDPLRNTVC
jgi:hypothetical protein